MSSLVLKYENLIKEGLLLLPDKILSKLIDRVDTAYREVPYLKQGEVHEVELNARKVSITSRGSLRDVAIDGIHYDSIAQAACSIYDPYDEYYDISYDIKNDLTQYTFIPIIDEEADNIRYTISKYSKGLKKYFDPHKVVKAVYTLNHILFYVKDKDDVLRKYYYKIGSINIRDFMPAICKAHAAKNGPNADLYLAFFIHEDDLPFTVGGCKEDFYALKDILKKISFKGTTPLKYMIFTDLKNANYKHIRDKEHLAYNNAIQLANMNKTLFCRSFNLEPDSFDEMLENDLKEIKDKNGKKITRKHIQKYLNIIDNVNELSFYESNNLMWKVKYDDIPSEI